MDERQSLSSDRQPPLKSLAGVLQAVVQRIKIEHYLLAIAVTILVVILVLGAIWIAPEFSGPVYAALIVIGVLALAALIVTAVLATKRQQGTKDKKGKESNVVSPDCESLRRQLEMARKTLAALEVQAAGYTVLTMPAYLQVDLEEQQHKVADLERRLAECLARSGAGE